jgi:hypothetical protein
MLQLPDRQLVRHGAELVGQFVHALLKRLNSIIRGHFIDPLYSLSF